jgi:hypothetical protein
MLYGGEISKNEEYRKKSSFFQIPPTKKAMLRLSPTSLHPEMTLRVDDCWQKFLNDSQKFS